jgi:ribosomal-protein-alanine N-acetyltransferase
MRLMTIADVPAVLRIEQEVQHYPWTSGNFTDAINSGNLCFVAQTGDQIMAYAILMPGVDDAELLNIAVATAHQRKGVGRKMLLFILDQASTLGLQRTLLEVRATNLCAIALYRATGFCNIAIRRAYYRDASGSEDAIVMTLVNAQTNSGRMA